MSTSGQNGRKRFSTAVTGYGHVTPKSDGGRAFTVIYALIGIPLQITTLAAVGGWLSRGLDRCFLRPCRFDDNDELRCTWSLGKHVARTIISFAVFLFFFAIIPAFIFQKLEDWTIGEGVYYALISLTTIGYGDYEAGALCLRHPTPTLYFQVVPLPRLSVRSSGHILLTVIFHGFLEQL